MKALVTGGAGFIGFNLVKTWPIREALQVEPDSPYGAGRLFEE